VKDKNQNGTDVRPTEIEIPIASMASIPRSEYTASVQLSHQLVRTL